MGFAHYSRGSVSQTSSNSSPQCFAFDPCDGTDSGGKRGVSWADGAEKDGNGWRLAICRSQIVLSILPGMVYRSIASPAARNALTNRSGSTSDFRYGTCRGLQAGKPHTRFRVIDPHHRMYPSLNLTSYRDLFQKPNSMLLAKFGSRTLHRLCRAKIGGNRYSAHPSLHASVGAQSHKTEKWYDGSRRKSKH